MFTKQEKEILDKSLKVSEIKKLNEVRYQASHKQTWFGYTNREVILGSLVVYPAYAIHSEEYLFAECKPSLIPMDKVYSW